ncbi:MAG: nucleoside-diphosphate sugar epimerase, partial [Hyphomicrobiales bacterium]|nr:nucleoside-diphosphate sugar epimerase [Hyphomicrobiales bacterium]
MGALEILHLSDDRPGHYHLAEGVIAALARLTETRVTTLSIRRRWLVPARLLRRLVDGGKVAPELVLKLGYGLARADLGNADLIISAGGQTLPANIAAARALDAANIFVGSLRRVDPENFSLVVTSYERHSELP